MENKIMRAVQLIKADAQLSVTDEDVNSIVWENGETPIAKADIEAKVSEAETLIANEAQAKKDLKASAKAKLIAGEALTEDEANTIVL